MALKIDTKRILADSLETLLEDKPFQSIKVKDITANCGASNATFYRHFKDKYDLMNWIYRSDVDAILSEYQDITAWREWLLQVPCFIQRKKDFFGKVVSYQEQNSFLDFLKEYSLEYFLSKTQKYIEPEKMNKAMSAGIKIFCYGCCLFVVEWIENGCIEPAEKQAEYIYISVPDALLQVIR